MSPRRDVSMSAEEVRSLLGQAHTGIFTTLGRDGYPHSTGMWFLPAEDRILMWTYAKSQKALNLRRDPRCAFLVESGGDYATLRGVLIRGDARLVSDYSHIVAVGKGLYERYTLPVTGIAYEGAAATEVERQARKRIGVEVPFTRLASWDHAKL